MYSAGVFAHARALAAAFQPDTIRPFTSHTASGCKPGGNQNTTDTGSETELTDGQYFSKKLQQHKEKGAE